MCKWVGDVCALVFVREGSLWKFTQFWLISLFIFHNRGHHACYIYSYTLGIMPEFTFAKLLMHVLKDAMRNPHILPEYYALSNGNFGKNEKCLMISMKCWSILETFKRLNNYDLTHIRHIQLSRPWCGMYRMVEIAFNAQMITIPSANWRKMNAIQKAYRNYSHSSSQWSS